MQHEALIDHYLLKILEANETTNLTRISSLEEARKLHIEDSLAGLQELQQAPKGLYGDLGTGGGFPGVPLAIESGRKTMLVDSVRKKMAIVESILSDMGLNDSISTYSGRIEDLANEHPQSFTALTARALSRLSVLMELASPLLSKNGLLICYKANVQDDEWDHALSLQDKLGLSLFSDRALTLSDGETLRRIICFEKIGKPKMKLPRRVGLAQKKPL
ncbi:16S rRNA (guanine(527)-N(7))-methyltransferase RsmG [Gordonibacter massiliensis (ex Traore et al. 2017)]|uniref:16S rRNA (guanine(527)-N(7))-methyltransferase RsmG n=1 Tax=Gordonibacter massiliensis (ex Traore et al. 2017) TaxID=1841863 RepID=UPI001C8C8C56|nr:16S rRNA (guanine(527)-N(7))-methyltransferase RsmG [Gordonibacter massiliensis (ex Traore et al. 2017)]MBX9032561.1 16S rRNA (guanine(527)-N(7))-methyltransferase RsmG [Gordonibacter massiliensis (ex Traore et al. 2017)]